MSRRTFATEQPMNRTCLWISALAFLAISFGWTGAVLAAGEKGAVDWPNGFVTAVGYGTAAPGNNPAKAMLNARRAAEIDAQRALLETIKGVHIDTQTTVGGTLQRDVVTRTRVEGVIRGATIANQDVKMVNGAPMATVTMRLCLDGRSPECAGKPALVSAIALETYANQPEPAVAYAAPGSEPPPSPAPGFPPTRRPALFDRTRPATGAILLLDNQRFERVLLPVVTAQQKGQYVLVYGVRRVAPEVVRTYGIVRYAISLDQARSMESAGANPIIIFVEGIDPNNRIAINPEDATVLEESIRYGNNFLEKGRVAIVQ
jgi:hypothetical protein